MSDLPQASSARLREFESTAIKKLMADGVPHDIAHAFVTIGIQKGGKYESIRDAVCKMEKVQFFLPTSVRDYRDPLRLGGTGAMVPRVVPHKLQRFYTQFAMSDVEAVKFTKAFPEFNVVTSGKTYNQHAYYGNKRYAESELLVSMVYQHANRGSKRLDPRAIVDLGGNMTWHVKRDRGHVHCDNPVLSSRDAARYVVREVFSGENPNMVCKKSFEECKVEADYAIAVHSTYDIEPKRLVIAMLRRNIKVFYGVMNIIPGLQDKPEGVYESDGMVATVVRPKKQPAYVKYTFSHDPALEYRHLVRNAVNYLSVNKRYDIVLPSGVVCSYVYKIVAVRGNSLVFSIEQGEGDYTVSTAVWSPPRRKCYFISVPMLGVRPLEVQCEFFDRMVMEAAGARGLVDYDIVSLFRYAKSLRQRVSINGIVLSSGYTVNPEQLVDVVIAAYMVAVAYRSESADFFAKASSQIMSHRGQGVVRDIYSVAVSAADALVKGLGTLLGKVTFYTVLSERVSKLLKTYAAVEVVVDKPHHGKGMTFMKDMLVIPPRPLRGDGGQVVLREPGSGPYTPLAIGGWRAALSSTSVKCDGASKVFYSFGVPALKDTERPRDCKPVYYELNDVATEYPVRSEEFRALVYDTMIKGRLGLVGVAETPLVLANGDRVWRRYPSSLSEGPVAEDSTGAFIGPQTQYIVFRGVGSRAVSLGRPRAYAKGICLSFVLFYEKDDEDYTRSVERRAFNSNSSQHTLVGGKPVGPTSSETDGVFYAGWHEVSSGSAGVVKYATVDDARQAVRRDVDAGYYTMTGARVTSTTTPPESIASTATTGAVVTKIHRAARSEPGEGEGEGDPSDAQHGMEVFEEEENDQGAPFVPESAPLPSVTLEAFSSAPVGGGGSERAAAQTSSSDDYAYGRDSALEFVRACEEAEKIALASTREYMDLAVAVVGKLAPASTWGAAMQGKQGNPVLVEVKGDTWVDKVTGDAVSHMAVSNGDTVYDSITKPPPDGIYVTSDVMRIYTGSAIKHAVQSVADENFECEVVSMDGVAGSGKTHHIVETAGAGDVVLCETKAAMEYTFKQLKKKKWFQGHGYTVDAFLCGLPVDKAEVLWVDESFRLHAAKVFTLMKLLKPRVVYCFGDSKQIPVLPYIPMLDFKFHKFPFTRTVFKRDSWRCPADICLGLSRPQYYNTHVVTHSPVRRSLKSASSYESGMFEAKDKSVVLLVYTQTVKEDLIQAGVSSVMTIGESQGSTFQDVILYRDSDLHKALYYDFEQTLVALSRHKVSLHYVSVSLGNDDGAAFELISWIRSTQTDLLLSAYFVSQADVPSQDSRGVAVEVFGDSEEGSDIVNVSDFEEL